MINVHLIEATECLQQTCPAIKGAEQINSRLEDCLCEMTVVCGLKAVVKDHWQDAAHCLKEPRGHKAWYYV